MVDSSRRISVQDPEDHERLIGAGALVSPSASRTDTKDSKPAQNGPDLLSPTFAADDKKKSITDEKSNMGPKVIDNDDSLSIVTDTVSANTHNKNFVMD